MRVISMKMVEKIMLRLSGGLPLFAIAFGLMLPNSAPAQLVQTAGQGVIWSTVGSGVATQPKGPITMVMYTQGQYEIFWRAMYGMVQAPPVSVEWGKEYLIGVCAGPQAEGASVRVQTISKINASTAAVQWYLNGGMVMHRTRQAQPPAKGGSPWEIDKVVAFGGRIAFQQVAAPQFGNGLFFTGNNWNCPPIVITNYVGPDGFLPYEVVDFGSYASVDNLGNVVITNQDQFTTYVQGLYGPQFQVPMGINWGQTMFAGITLSNCPTTGYSIQVMGLRQIGPSQYKLFYSVGSPEPGQIAGQVVTNPHVLVRIPKVTGTITFERVDPKNGGLSGSGPSRGGTFGN